MQILLIIFNHQLINLNLKVFILKLNMISGVYVIINKINSKIYVGSTINFNKRWKQHISALNLNRHDNSYLQKSWNKYGKINFEFKVIEEVEPEFLLEREQYYINLYNACDKNSGYNLLPIAGNMLGYKHTDESKEKISASHKGKILSADTKNKIGLGHTGIKYKTNRKEKRVIKHSDETKLKMSEIRKGKKYTDEAKKNMSLAKKGKCLSDETKKKISNALKGNKNGFGRIVTEETKKNISLSHKGINQGKKNGRAMAITNAKEVIAIRNDYDNGMTIRNLQIKYNRNYSLIYNIVKKITWSWLDDASFSN